MNKWIAEFELEDGDTMPEHMDLNYKGAKIDFHCKPLEKAPITKNDLGVDCISRADVNRLICKYRDYATETGNERDLERAYGANKVGILISELPSVTPQTPRWIPVSERLPEEMGTYMTTIDYGKHGLAAGQRFYHGQGLWEDNCVIAWMPLPKPYEESEGV